MIEVNEELSTYQEVYAQLTALKHLIYSCVDLSHDLESVAVLFSQQISRIEGYTPNSVWLLKDDHLIEDVALDGKRIEVSQRLVRRWEEFTSLRRVIGEQVVVWTSDLIDDLDLFPFFQSPVLFPIKGGASALGFVVVEMLQPEQADLFQSIANFAGLIFNACRLHGEVEEQRQDLSEMTELLLTQNAQMVSLYRASLRFAQAEEPAELWNILTEYLVKEFGASRAAAFSLNQATSELTCESSSGGGQSIAGLKLSLQDEEILRHAVESGRTLNHLDHPGPLLLGGNRLEEWSIFPVKGADMVLGALIAAIDQEDNRDPISILIKNAAMMIEAMAQIKILKGLIPICSFCKNIRDDEGYWQQLEQYIHDRSDARFSHSICPECIKKHYPDFSS